MEGPSNYEALSSIKKIAITSVDSWFGYSSAFILARELAIHCPTVKLVCLARKTENLHHLQKLTNVQIHKIDYNDEKSLEKQLCDVNCIVLIPEMEESRAKLAKNILSAAKNENVKACLLLSVQGADNASSDLKEITTFHEIEEDVKKHCEHYMILRKSFLNQSFLYWAHCVKKTSEFPITTNNDSVMAPIDMFDINLAIGTVVVEYCRHEPPSHSSQQQQKQLMVNLENKTFTLTGPQTITAECLVQELCEATEQEIKLKQVSREDLKKALESVKGHNGLSEEFDLIKFHQYMVSWLDNGVDAEISDGHHHRHHHHHHHQDHHAPNESTINLILDELDLVKNGKAGFVSDDLQKIIGRPGSNINNFLHRERNAFKPHHK
ncbi:hypothetical protein BGX27_010175 [Mortierella sp. AM989]|nr:hypothetical protein BGX27_010175 [Mortierella sp. AM989]